MLLAQILYSLILQILAFPLILILFLIGWKKNTLERNGRFLRIPVSAHFRIRLYHHAAVDALKVLFGWYGRPIQIRSKDRGKIELLKTKSSLFLSAHFHNWEVMGSWLITKQGIPLLSAALPFFNPRSQCLLKFSRRRLGIPTLDKAVPRSALRHLLANQCFGMLWDQYPAQGNCFIPFLDTTMRVDPLPTFLIEKSEATVFFGALLPSGVFRLIQLSSVSRKNQLSQSSALPLSSFPPPEISTSQPHSPWPLRVAVRYHRVLSLLFRMYPEYYYGLTHRRFKDQITYRISGSVSRETPSNNSVMVSRETKNKT